MTTMLILLCKLVLASSWFVLGSVLFSADAQNVTALTLVTTAETLAAVGVPCSVPGTTCKVSIKAILSITAGTSTTSIVVKIYRGSGITGTLLSTFTLASGYFVVGS